MDLLRVSIRRAGFVSCLMNPNPLLAPLAVSSGVGTAGLRCSSCRAQLPYSSTPPASSAYSVAPSPRCPLVGLELGRLACKEWCSSGHFCLGGKKPRSCWFSRAALSSVFWS